MLYGACVLLGIFTGLTQGPVVAALAESLPRRARAGTLSLVYALAIAVFGGSTQFVIKWLQRETGNALAPGWYMLGAALLGLLSMILLRESAPARQAPATAGAPAQGTRPLSVKTGPTPQSGRFPQQK